MSANNMHHKVIAAAIAASALALPAVADQAADTGKSTSANTNTGAASPALTLYDTTDGASNLTLTQLRDSGLALNQIRQQAINIFQEATRKSCDSTSKFELLIPNTISEKDIASDHSKHSYLPPRQQWLIYYVGTVEPIITLFTQDVHDAKAGVNKLLVPADTKAKLTPTWHEWTQNLELINKELNDINDLINQEKPDNLSLAKHAVNIFKHTESLERNRQKAFLLIRGSEKRNGDTDKVNIE